MAAAGEQRGAPRGVRGRSRRALRALHAWVAFAVEASAVVLGLAAALEDADGRAEARALRSWRSYRIHIAQCRKMLTDAFRYWLHASAIEALLHWAHLAASTRPRRHAERRRARRLLAAALSIWHDVTTSDLRSEDALSSDGSEMATGGRPGGRALSAGHDSGSRTDYRPGSRLRPSLLVGRAQGQGLGAARSSSGSPLVR